MTSKKTLPLDTAERQLDRIQTFFPRIDSKVSAIFATASAQIAVAAVGISYGDLKLWWISIPAALFLAGMIWCMLNLYWCTFPHLDGGEKSLVYFNEIAKLREADYLEKYGVILEEELRRDVIGQIWRNSEIVAEKYRYLKHATRAVMLSVVPWVMLLVATSIGSGVLPGD